MICACLAPFRDASKEKDNLFKNLKNGNYDAYWKLFAEDGFSPSNEFKDLIQLMLLHDRHQRATIADIKAHPWFTKRVETPAGLIDDVPSDEEAKEEMDRRERLFRPATRAWLENEEEKVSYES